MKNVKWILIICNAYAIGYGDNGATHGNHKPESEAAAQYKTWTCSMHANVKLPNKGQ